MMHPSEDMIYEVARKEVNGEVLTAEEAAVKGHFAECESCRNDFLDMMQVLDFLSEGKFAPYLLQAVERVKLSAKVLFQMRFVMEAAGKLQVLSERISGDRPVFMQEPVYAAARGVRKELSEFTADASIIRYDHEKHRLTVSIDEELAEGRELSAVLMYEGGELCQKLDSDGHGMLETEFCLGDDREFSLAIEID